MPQVGPRKALQKRNKDSVKTHSIMCVEEKDHGFYGENFNSRSRCLPKDNRKQQSTKPAEDENRLVNGDRWSLFTSGQPFERESSPPGMGRFWEGQTEVKDWEEDCQSPSASESSSSLSTHESSFSGTSEASSLARMDFLHCTANQSGHFSDSPFLSPHVPQLAAISMQKPTGTDRTLQQSSVQSYRFECRKQQKEQDLCKLRSLEDKIVWNSDVSQSVSVPSISQQDKQNTDPDYLRSLVGDCSMEYLDEGLSSDSSSSTHSWASAYSQEFSSESRWQSFDAIYDSEDLQIHDDIHSNAACHTEGGGHIDFQHDAENVALSCQVQPLSPSKEEVEMPSQYAFFRKSSYALRAISSDLHGRKVITGPRISASINESELQRENKEVLFDGNTFHMPVASHLDYDATSPASTSSSLSSWVPNSPRNSGDWTTNYCDRMLQPALISVQPEAATITSASQQCSTSHESVTHMKATDPELQLHTEILDAQRNSSEESVCLRSSEKSVDGSPHIPCELSEPKVNEVIPSSQKTSVWSREKHAIPAVEKISGLCKPLLPASHTTAGLPYVGAAGHMKVLPSVGSKSGHSAAVTEKFASKPLRGYFRFVEQGGSPCYTFFVNNSDEVFFARAFRQENRSNKKNCDWMYSFHSRREEEKVNYAWKGWGKKEKFASDLVGKMSVSQGRHIDNISFGKSSTKETQFVLFGSGAHSLDTQTVNPDNMPHRHTSEILKPVVDDGMPTLLRASVLPGFQRKHIYQRATPKSLNVLNQSNGSITSDLREADCTDEGRLKQRSDIPKQTHDASSLKGSILPQSKTAKSHIELAAIVISTSIKVENLSRSSSRNPDRQETVGWGLKFLEKGSGNGWGLKFLGKNSIHNHNLEAGLEAHETQADHPCIKCEEITECDETLRKSRNSQARQQQHKPKAGKENCLNDSESLLHTGDLISAEYKQLMRKNSRTNASVDVTVILPAGDHGLPTGASDGPTPLVERWRSGGNCDCGGWDLGCGLSIFSTETLTLHGVGENIALTSHDRINWLSPGNPLKIFTQDYSRKVVLGIEKIEAGFFSLRFQARYSPLQAFATAVAILHEQITNK